MRLGIPAFPSELGAACRVFVDVANAAWKLHSEFPDRYASVVEQRSDENLGVSRFVRAIREYKAVAAIEVSNEQLESSLRRALKFGEVFNDRNALLFVPHPLRLALVVAEELLAPPLRVALRRWVGRYLCATEAGDTSLSALEDFITRSMAQPGAYDGRGLRSTNRGEQTVLLWLAALGSLAWNPRSDTYRLVHWGPGLRSLLGAGGTLTGYIVPDAGFSSILSGGFRAPDGEGLVTLIVGGPGSGKTSLASLLGVGSLLQGGAAIYISLEESTKAIRKKFELCVPFASSGDLAELEARKQILLVGIDRLTLPGEELGDQVSTRIERVSQNIGSMAWNQMPLCIVVDSLTAYALATRSASAVEHPREALATLITNWRKQGVHTVLVMGSSPQDLAEHAEYLADNVIELEHDDTGRRLRLVKTRFQASRPDAHILHISGSDGIRIFPDETSLGAAFKRARTENAVRRCIPIAWITAQRAEPQQQSFLFEDGTDELVTDPASYLRIAACAPEGTHITVFGTGSTGKSAFALRILMSKAIVLDGTDDNLEKIRAYEPRRSGISSRREVSLRVFPDLPPSPEIDVSRRVLVVSFHHPASTYRRYIRNLTRGEQNRSRLLSVLTLYPGDIQPAILLWKVEEALRHGSDDGVPFTGVVIDGIHNALVGFSNLAASMGLWASLISLCSLYRTTLVTTYSSMAIDVKSTRAHLAFGGKTSDNYELEDLLLARSNTCVLFTEREGIPIVSVPDSTVIRQARDIGFAWSTSSFDYRPRRPVVVEQGLEATRTPVL